MEHQWTTKEMLSEVDKALVSVLVGGQSYKIGSRQLTRADARFLREFKNDLTAQIAREENNGLLDDTFVAYFDGR
ncbi:MAG: peptidylprolyl isomerase [Eubacteriales bacterium]|nr:peptidylprolyl isomerase [Eubacteriales bacterium]